MMLLPSIMDLMKKTGSRYSLVIATAKRAREIEEEAAEAKTKELDGARSISKAATEIANGDVLVFDSEDEAEVVIENIED